MTGQAKGDLLIQVAAY